MCCGWGILSLTSLQKVVLQVNISELKKAVQEYLNGGLSIDEIKSVVEQAGKAGARIKYDVPTWRHEVAGYNPLIDKGAVSSFDAFVNKLYRFLKIRQPFGEREHQLLEVLTEWSYPHYLIAYLFSRSLQEIRLELKKIEAQERDRA